MATSCPKRRIFVNIDPTDEFFDSFGKPIYSFPSNEVHTSKYTLLTFLPKTLYEQFRRVANLFFLSLVILQCFPEFATVSPYVAAAPLLVIVLLTAAKDGGEDMKRKKTDNEINHQLTKTIDGLKNFNNQFLKNPAKKRTKKKKNNRSVFPESKRPTTSDLGWKSTYWKDIEVGNFIILRNDDPIPADIFVLATSDPDCLCYVETKNLDGETNLKILRGVVETSFLTTTGECAKIEFYVDIENPTPNLYSFSGNLVISKEAINYIAEKTAVYGIEFSEVEVVESSNINQSRSTNLSQHPNSNSEQNAFQNMDDFATVPININNLLLRGCILRNTEWVIGLVLATGSDTKIRLNSGETPSKRSVIEKKMNWHIILNLIFLSILCIITATASPLWETLSSASLDFSSSGLYSVISVNLVWQWFQIFFNSLITYQNIVPISLYLTVEVVKTLQAYFIYHDIELYYEKLNRRCTPRAWNLSDDLGQIEYIFSDKTGTLTRNIMEFKKCTINGIVYGEDQNDPFNQDEINRRMENQPLSENGYFYDAKLAESLSVITDPQHIHTQKFFTALVVCHSVLISHFDNNEDGSGINLKTVSYKASSPDEAALVKAAKDMGFIFVGRESDSLIVNILGIEQRYLILNVIEFNSTRKRMSIIAKCPDGQIRVFCKGADSVIYERLRENQTEKKELISHQMDLFAQNGLRTLCISSVVLTEQEYELWDQEYQTAALSLVDREVAIDNVAEKIEGNLNLLGATAIEDKLQEDVPQSIFTLARAGIKLWVLTGDKVETAINIGFSCNLLKRNMNLILIRTPEQYEKGFDSLNIIEQMEKSLKEYFGLKVVYNGSSLPHVEPIPHEMVGFSQNALIIDGGALKQALANKVNAHVFWMLSTRCDAVLCCRVSPLQKAQVVSLVKHTGKGAVCLAIGDGANDVGMIQAAHIGVGISGEEGLQAVMASDYSFGQFKYLTRLLLIHGHWCYVKTSEMILAFFFKNIIYVLPMFWYQYLCGFSSQMIFEFSYMLLYNMVFTSMPVIAMGIFERDISTEFAMHVPSIYISGVKNDSFTTKRFFIFVLEAVYQSLVCFYIPLAAYNEAATDSSGRSTFDIELGVVMAIVTIWNSNMFVFLQTHRKSWPVFAAIIFSNGILILWTIAYSILPESPIGDAGIKLLRTITFYLVMVVSTTVCHLPRVLITFSIQQKHPNDLNIIQEIEDADKFQVRQDFEAFRKASIMNFKERNSVVSFFKKDDISIAGTEDSKRSNRPPQRVSFSQPDVSEIVEINIEDDRDSIDNLRVHFGQPTFNIEQEDSEEAIPFPEIRESRLSKANSDTQMSVHLSVMSKKQNYGVDARGFSFSESPGVRDIILGRKDIRANPLRRDDDPRRLSVYNSTNSTQSAPKIRPRANTFTYGKRIHHSISASDGIDKKEKERE